MDTGKQGKPETEANKPTNVWQKVQSETFSLPERKQAIKC